MELKFACEAFGSVIAEARPLLQLHWEELALNQELVPLDPDYNKYYEIARLELMRVFTIRAEGMLIGYANYYVFPHMHYKSTCFAESDIFYLAKEFRGGRTALRFFRFIEDSLREAGVVVMHTRTKVAHPAAGRVLEASGHRLAEHGYSKFIGVRGDGN